MNIKIMPIKDYKLQNMRIKDDFKNTYKDRYI